MSNAFDKASLVMLPHAYEEGKLYSLKPTDRSGDFTFSRGTDTATRVNEQGYIEKETANLLLQSNEFDTTWTTSNAGVTGGQSGYDGSSDAWLFENNQVASSASLAQSFSSSSVNVYSVYAKAGTTNWLNLRTEAAGKSVWFDLGNGVIGTEKASTISSSIESVGNGWYRLSIAFDSCTAVRFYVVDGNNSFAVTNGANVYIQDAQLNQGLVAQPYLETTTVPVYGGLTDNMPRLDYTDASCPSLLLEPSRTNFITYSEYLLDGWTDTGCTITKTNETNPSGNDISYFATAIDSDNADRIRYFGGTKNGDYYFSFFAKGDGNAHQIYLRGLGGSGAANMYWDVAADGTISFNSNDSDANGSPISENYGNGWYRIGFKQTFTGANAYSDIRPSRGDINSGIYVWGVQWEQGSYPTSYIPTYGSTQTRGGDVLGNSNNISGLFNDNKGTLYFETNNTIFKGETTNKNLFGLTESSSGNYFRFRGSNSNVLVQSIGFGSNISFNPSGATLTKYLYKWDGSTIKLFVDGVERGSVSQTATFNPNLFRIGFNFGFVSNTKQLLIFPTALSDAECIALTTL